MLVITSVPFLIFHRYAATSALKGELYQLQQIRNDGLILLNYNVKTQSKLERGQIYLGEAWKSTVWRHVDCSEDKPKLLLM